MSDREDGTGSRARKLPVQVFLEIVTVLPPITQRLVIGAECIAQGSQVVRKLRRSV
jgi:hypothetical protein